MTTKYRPGDIVSVQGKVDMVYLSDTYRDRDEENRERVVIKLDGHYGTVTLGAPLVTLVQPLIEAGMSVYDNNTEESYEVLHVLDDTWIVGKRIGLGGYTPVILRGATLEVIEAPGHEAVDLLELKEDELPAAPPPAPPIAPRSDEELKAELDPELGPTTVDQGYPQNWHDANKLAKDIALTIGKPHRDEVDSF
jgi:hypothetical protein